ncbi:hypothetical protein [Kitasatospora sp. NPDC101183]|uniref:hypothetical protein n=1 Tax=Kitasatospora sp. NPDC101183 TaxID=3364100 RepID=UPI003811A9F1
MVEHPELCEDVTEALARAGFDTGPGASPLRIGPGPEGVVVGWSPGEEPGGPPSGEPSGAARAAVVEAAAVVLRERGHLVAGTADGGLLVTAVEPVNAPEEPEAVPGQWWG